jgi:hypothetical protein
MKGTHKLVLIMIILIAFIYLRYYVGVVNTIKILQAPVSELTPSLLMQRFPIVIEDRIVNPLSLLQTVFKWQYLYKRVTTMESSSEAYRRNDARYLLLFSNREGASIEIANPKKRASGVEELPFVELLLHENMCAVIPFGWLYRIRDAQGLGSFALYDLTALTVGKLF